MKNVIIVGPMPPPVHGMSKNLKIFYEDVSCATTTTTINTSPGTITRGWRYHVSKLLKVARGGFSFLTYCLKRDVKSLYLPPDAGYGAYYSFIFVLIARTFGIPIFLHHRSFLYINERTLGMFLITSAAGRRAQHIFLCEQMRVQFEALYGARNASIVSNAHYVAPIESIGESEGPITIGFLSNLGFEKGLSRVFDVCSTLLSEGVDFTLRLAGPAENSEVEQYLNEKLVEFSGTVEYLGFVSGEEKEEFYRSLDVFIFPTLYRNEAQPNVLFEAAAAGAAILSLDVGCIGSDFGCESGKIYKSSDEFVNEAPGLLFYLSNDKAALNELRRCSLLNITEARNTSRAAYDQLIEAVVEGRL